MNVWKTSAGCALLIITSLCASASEVVEQARTSYENALKKIEAQYTHRITIWPDEYLKQVGTLADTLQKQGNLEGVLIVRNEMTRFNGNKTIPESALSADSDDLKAIQVRFNTLKEKFSTEKHQSVLALAGKYEAHLKAKQAELTRADRMDDAIACRDEIARLQDAPEITAARFVVAVDEQGDASATPEPKAAATPKTPDTSAKATPAVELVKETYGKSYFTIHKQGKFPPRPERGVFKRVSMRTTPNVSGRKVAMSLMINDETTPTRSNGGTRLYLKEVTTARVQLKTASSSGALEKPQLMIQYFAVSPGNKRFGQKKPFEHSYHTVELPHLSGTALNVDCPAAGRPPEDSSSVRVYKHYGVVVSVFDQKGNLISQESFPTSLAERARTKTHNTAKPAAAIPKELAEKSSREIYKSYQIAKSKLILLSEEIENGRTDDAALEQQAALKAETRTLYSAYKAAKRREKAAAAD